MGVQKFKQKLPEIEAIQNTGDNLKEVLDFIGSKLEDDSELADYAYNEDKDIVNADGNPFIPFNDWCAFEHGEFASYDNDGINFYWELITN